MSDRGSEEDIKTAEKMLDDLRLDELESLGLIPRGGQFSPSIHYPPIEDYPPMDEAAFFDDFRPPEDHKFVVYAHIPFCINRCVYCHFAVRTGCSAAEKDLYLDMIDKEAAAYAARLGLDRIKARSVLIGGGTPTDLSPGQLERFLVSFTSRVDLSGSSQFSYDVDPSTLLGDEGAERLRILRSYGVDRLTIGAQSFDDDVLKHMNRAHNAKDVRDAVDAARSAGFGNVCVELIYGYPAQTIHSWIRDLEEAFSIGAEEVQMYRLRVTPYGPHEGAILREFRKKREDFPDAHTTGLMKALGMVVAGHNGYTENLTRVFARGPQYFSRYARDFSCLTHDLIGFGLSSWSAHGAAIGWNVREDISKYEGLVSRGKVPIVSGIERTVDDEMRRHITMPLKCWGKVMKKVYEERTGIPFDGVFKSKREALVKHGLIVEDGEKMTLTPRGRFVADEVCQFFYHPDHAPFKKEAYADGELNLYTDIAA